MHKLIPVEEAKTLMNEAQDWSIWGWLTEKRRLRTTADTAWEALDACEKEVKDSWNEELKKAWREAEALAALQEHPRTKRSYEKAKEEAKDVDPEVKAAVGKLKEADAEAYAARMKAEETFDEADRRMSTKMACEGALQAIDAWEMREKFVRKLEHIGRQK